MSKENNQSGPSLGGPTSPKLDKEDENEIQSKTQIEEDKEEEIDKSKNNKSKNKINVHELVRVFGVTRRRVRDALQTMMIREIKEKVRMTKVNELFRRNILELMNGHIEYFEEMIDTINNGEDELSKDLEKNRTASTQVFETLHEIISREIERFKEEKPIIVDYLDEDLKRFRDARVEPRASWWVLWYTGLQLREIRERAGEKLDIVLDVMLRHKPVMRRVLGVYLNFADQLVQQFHPFPLEYSRVNLIANPTNTGYNMAPWIKPRYGTYSQSYMEYERFLKYYARSFGTVPGNAPEFEGGPLNGYRQWMQRTLETLEEKMRNSSLITSQARGDTLEGMLVGIKDQLEEVLEKREYDENGKLVNQPIGGEGALKFIDWLFHTALNRYSTTNIAIHAEARMSLDMFKFIPDTVRWVNEYGEQIVMDWLKFDRSK